MVRVEVGGRMVSAKVLVRVSFESYNGYRVWVRVRVWFWLGYTELYGLVLA